MVTEREVRVGPSIMRARPWIALLIALTAGLTASGQSARQPAPPSEGPAPGIVAPPSLAPTPPRAISRPGHPVAAAPDLIVTVDATVESSVDFKTEAATTQHHLVIEPPAVAAEGSIELIADGSFGTGFARAQADAEGVVSLETPATGRECASASVRKTLSPADLTALTADGSVDVTVTNSYFVDPSCPVNRHTIRLNYQTPAARIDFGEVRTGADRSLSITVINPSTSTRIVTITSDAASYLPDASSVTIGPLDSLQTLVRFAPTMLGAMNGKLVLTGSLPGDVPWSIDLSGVGVAPPDLKISPDSLSAIVPVGGTHDQSIAISNLGDRPVDFELRVESPGPQGVRRAVVLDGSPPRLVAIDLETGARVSVGLGKDLSGAMLVALDPSGHRAYLVTTPGALYSVDLDDGKETLVDTGFANVAAIAVNRDGSAIYLLDWVKGQVIAINPALGDEAVVASGLNYARWLALSSTADEIFVADYQQLVRIDVATGALSPVTRSLGGVSGLAVDRGRGVAYVTQWEDGVFEVELATGTVTPILLNSRATLKTISLVDGGRRALVLDWDRREFWQVDLARDTYAPWFTDVNAPLDLSVRDDDTQPIDFLTVAPTQGTILPSGLQTIDARFLAGELPPGEYAASVVLRETGLAAPLSILPATLTVVSSPHLVITGATRTVEVTRKAGARYDRRTILDLNLPLSDPPTGPGFLEVTTAALLGQGDVPVSVEGYSLGANPRVVCAATTRGYVVPADIMTEIASDGIVEVELFLNATEDFGPACAVNRFTARLTYPGSADGFDFGSLDVGQRKTLDIGVTNAGNEALALSSFVAVGDGLSTTQTNLVLQPGETSSLDVTLEAVTPGVIQGVLQFETNEPGAGRVEVPLVAQVVGPPGISVQPETLTISLPEGRSTSTSLALSNEGGAPLEYSLRLPGRMPSGASSIPCPPQSLVTTHLEAVDLDTGVRTILPHSPDASFSNYNVASDAAGSTAFIAYGGSSGGVYEADLSTGAGRQIAGIELPKGVALSPDERTVYAVGDGLFRIDRRTLVLDKVAEFRNGQGIALDERGTTAFVTANDVLMAVDLATGNVTTLNASLKSPAGVALVPDDSGAYLIETYPGDLFRNSLVHVDFANGQVTPVLSGLDGGEDVALDASRGVAYVGEDVTRLVDAVNLTTGRSTVLADHVNSYGFTLRPSLACSGRYVRIPNRTGEVPPLSASDVPLTVDSTGLSSGTYVTTLEIRSNDPVHPIVTVPVTLEVLADRDGDGVADASDNCPDLANADQADRDGDGRGDVCDNCPAVANPDQADFNADGSGDACQPRADLLDIRQDGGRFLEVRAHVSDPQNETLTGTVAIDPVAGGSAPAAHRSPAPAGATGMVVPFAGRLPRTILLDGLSPGTTYRLTITATDGNTKPIAVMGDFLYQGETDLAFDDPPVAAFTALPRRLECNRPGGAEVTLSGAPSQDPDSSPGTHDDIRSFAWILDAGLPGEMNLGAGESLDAIAPLGSHTIALRVTDSIGETDAASTAIAIVDTTPPVASLTADPAILFPPNHEMRQARLVWQAADACDPAPAATLASVTSSEPDDATGDGDGHTTGDIQTPPPGQAPATIGLRAERSGAGAGRVYEIRGQVSDASGNAVPVATSVVVPHDKGQGPEPLILRLERVAGNGGGGGSGGGGVLISWTGLVEAGSYDLITGDLASWHPEGEVLGLGDVRVLARATTLTSVTEGAASPDPAVGHAWFYLVQERIDGLGAGFGTVTAPWPRRPDSCSGGCP